MMYIFKGLSLAVVSLFLINGVVNAVTYTCWRVNAGFDTELGFVEVAEGQDPAALCREKYAVSSSPIEDIRAFKADINSKQIDQLQHGEL